MMAKLWSRSIRAICVGGMVLGMTTAMAQDTSVVLQHVDSAGDERLIVVAYNDPEGEISNGTNPPRREANSGTETRDDFDVPMDVDNYPETEVGNGTSPQNVNPMGQETSVGLQQVEAAASEGLIVIAYSDPEGEVGNGTYPPNREANSETEAGDDFDLPIEINNFPESEITNGMDPPK